MNDSKMIVDRYTSFKEMMDWINAVVSPSERCARANYVFQKAPYLKQTMEMYFNDAPHKFSKLSENIDDIVSKIRPLGIKDHANFGLFVRDGYMWGDDSPLNDYNLKSKLSGLLDYTIPSDVEFISKFVKLSEIEEFTEFGLDTYNMLVGK